MGRQPSVVENRAPPPVGLHGDQRREPVLGDQLLAIGEVVREVPVNIFRPSHQDIHEVVHHDRDFGAIDRLEWHDPIVRGRDSVGSDGHAVSLQPLTQRNKRPVRLDPHLRY